MKLTLIASILSLVVLSNCQSSTSQLYDDAQSDQNTDSTTAQLQLDPGCEADLTQTLTENFDHQLWLLSYNVYNLFDTQHDVDNNEDKNDWEYMAEVKLDQDGGYLSGPQEKYEGCLAAKNSGLEKCLNLSETDQVECEKRIKGYYKKCITNDWSQENLEKKLDQLVFAFDTFHKSKRPDILVLSEVENPVILSKLAKKLGYTNKIASAANQTKELPSKGEAACQDFGVEGLSMTTSPDNRGIDLAILHNTQNQDLEFKGCREYNARSGGNRDTRNILEVEFLLGGDQRIFIYANHWPSQSGPTFLRDNVAKRLKEIIASRKKKDPDAEYIVAGDFNVVPGDVQPQRPIDDGLLGDGNLVDIWSNQGNQQAGSYYYAPGLSWNRLDRMIVSKDLSNPSNKVHVAPDSFTVHNNKPLIYKKSLKVFRDLEAIEKLRSQGENIKYENILADYNVASLSGLFDGNQEINTVEVIETCSPDKFVSHRGRGFSDHFAISMRINY